MRWASYKLPASEESKNPVQRGQKIPTNPTEKHEVSAAEVQKDAKLEGTIETTQVLMLTLRRARLL
jgi:hypothetical protein